MFVLLCQVHTRKSRICSPCSFLPGCKIPDGPELTSPAHGTFLNALKIRFSLSPSLPPSLSRTCSLFLPPSLPLSRARALSPPRSLSHTRTHTHTQRHKHVRVRAYSVWMSCPASIRCRGSRSCNKTRPLGNKTADARCNDPGKLLPRAPKDALSKQLPPEEQTR